MKYLLLLFFFISSHSCFSQQNHFIYIQTEDKQPFYVKLDRKILSSTVSGYIIIPQLRDSTYQLLIGFPKNLWPEQRFSCTLNRKDQGYLLKPGAGNNWVLFNLQTMELLKADTGRDQVIRKDGFAEELSSVIGDPGLLKSNKGAEQLSDEMKYPVKDSVEKQPVNKIIKPTAKVIATKPVVKSGSEIRKIADQKIGEIIRLVYVDGSGAVADTVTVLIPIAAPVSKDKVPGKTNTDHR